MTSHQDTDSSTRRLQDCVGWYRQSGVSSYGVCSNGSCEMDAEYGSSVVGLELRWTPNRWMRHCGILRRTINTRKWRIGSGWKWWSRYEIISSYWIELFEVFWWLKYSLWCFRWWYRWCIRWRIRWRSCWCIHWLYRWYFRIDLWAPWLIRPRGELRTNTLVGHDKQ